MRYLYHGSPAKDKESILRDGLKCQDPRHRCVCLSYSASDAHDFVTGIGFKLEES